MQDDLVGDDLNVARLEYLAQVELGILRNCSKRPVSRPSSYNLTNVLRLLKQHVADRTC